MTNLTAFPRRFCNSHFAKRQPALRDPLLLLTREQVIDFPLLGEQVSFQSRSALPAFGTATVARVDLPAGEWIVLAKGTSRGRLNGPELGMRMRRLDVASTIVATEDLHLPVSMPWAFCFRSARSSP